MKRIALPQGRRAWLLAGGALLVAGALALVIPAHDWTELLEAKLESHNRVQALLLFGAAYVVGTLLLVPAWIFPLAAGAAFGPWWGLAAAVVSSAAAALAAYVVARYVVRERVERLARRNATFTEVDKAVKREPFKVVALLRLSPVLPSGLKSYFLGLTCVRPLPYLAASVLGMFPGIALKVFLGHAGRDALAGGPLQWAILAGGIAATVGVAWTVGRKARKRLGLG